MGQVESANVKSKTHRHLVTTLLPPPHIWCGMISSPTAPCIRQGRAAAQPPRCASTSLLPAGCWQWQPPQMQLRNQSANHCPDATRSQEDRQMVCHHRMLEIEMIPRKQRNRCGDTGNCSNQAQPSHRQIQKSSGPQSQKVLDPNCEPELTRYLAQQPQKHWISRGHPEVAVDRPSAYSGIARRIRVKQDCGEIG